MHLRSSLALDIVQQPRLVAAYGRKRPLHIDLLKLARHGIRTFYARGSYTSERSVLLHLDRRTIIGILCGALIIVGGVETP